VVHFDEGDGDVQLGKACFERVDDMACRAVAGINDELERLDGGWFDVSQQMLDVGGED